MQQVRGPRNRMVVDAARLHRARFRKERGLTLVEGPKLVSDALAAGVPLRAAFVREGDTASIEMLAEREIKPVLVDDRALARLTGTETPRGPVAVMEIPATRLDPEAGVLVGVGVSDPGNVGTLVRTAAAFGWGYAYTAGSADPWSPKALRAGAGGHFLTPVVPLDSVRDIEGWSVVATAPAGGAPLSEVGPGPVAVLVGEEASGLDDNVVAAADLMVTVPMPGGTESLNVASVASIVVYELSKPGGLRGDRV